METSKSSKDEKEWLVLETTAEKLKETLDTLVKKNSDVIGATIVEKNGLVIAESVRDQASFNPTALSAIGLELSTKANTLISTYITSDSLARVRLETPKYEVHIFPGGDFEMALIVVKKNRRPGLFSRLFKKSGKEAQAFRDSLQQAFDILSK
ncbi:MAG: roadblock/LC7 domain-containing protein [Promethearchaeota archaeon]